LCKRSEEDEIVTEEAKRSPLSPDFPFKKGNQKNLGITAIKGTIRRRIVIQLPHPNSKDTVIRANVVEGTKSNLKKRSVRLCLRIFPLRKGIKKIWRQQRSEDRFVTETPPTRRTKPIF